MQSGNATLDVSVVIPAWNAAGCIAVAIASALRQDNVALEVIVADDASNDATAAVVQADGDRRVRYLRLPQNGGPSAARNAALAIAQGRWIAVLDADDALLPDRLSRLVGVAESNKLDIIADNMWLAPDDGDRRTLMLDRPLDGRLQPIGLRDYLLGNLLFGRQRGYGYLKPLFRSAFLQQHALRYDESLRIGEDFHLVAEALALGARFGLHASAGYLYTVHSGSTSHRLSLAQAQAMIDADCRFLARFGNALPADAVKAAHAHLRSLEQGAAFIAMVDCVKQRRLGGLLRQAGRHPAALRHFSMPLRAAFSRFRQALPA